MNTNLGGTLNLIELSDKHKVEKFVLVSTDKAVNPVNVMGATKRAAEKLIQSYNIKSKLTLMAVRFGNVLEVQECNSHFKNKLSRWTDNHTSRDDSIFYVDY